MTEKSQSLSTSGSLSRPEALAAAYIGPAIVSRSSVSSGASGLAGILQHGELQLVLAGLLLEVETEIGAVLVDREPGRNGGVR